MYQYSEQNLWIVKQTLGTGSGSGSEKGKGKGKRCTMAESRIGHFGIMSRHVKRRVFGWDCVSRKWRFPAGPDFR